MYESERESIEGQYWDARDQVRQRLLSAIEDRRRKLREEKEGGDVVTGELPLTPFPTSASKLTGRIAARGTDEAPPNPPHALPITYRLAHLRRGHTLRSPKPPSLHPSHTPTSEWDKAQRPHAARAARTGIVNNINGRYPLSAVFVAHRHPTREPHSNITARQKRAEAKGVGGEQGAARCAGDAHRAGYRFRSASASGTEGDKRSGRYGPMGAGQESG